MSEFLMPSLGADMEAGTLVEWLVKPDEQVNRGDVIAVVETQKGAIEIEIFEDGVLEKYLVDIGKKVPVGTPLAKIKQAREAETLKPRPHIVPIEVTPEIAEIDEFDNVPEFAKPQKGRRFRITPAARQLAETSGLNLASFKKNASGPGGAITLFDVEAMIGRKPDTSIEIASAVGPVKMTGMRGAIAAAMSRSKRDIPHYYLAHTIDLSKAENFVIKSNEVRPPTDRLLLGALYLKAVARAVGKFPEFNGHFIDGLFQQSAAAHIGMAIKIRGGGLVAPAIHDAQSLELDVAMSALRDLASRVRAGRFRSSEISDATITISSLGDRGVESLYGIIYPPQVAIIGFGTPSMRPWVNGETVEARRVATITLAADHRVSDGHRGALFLNAIDIFLQEPETL